MKDLNDIPKVMELVHHVKGSRPRNYHPNKDNDRIIVPLSSERDTAIANMGEGHIIYILWSNEVPLFGSREYRLVILVEEYGGVIKNKRTMYFVHGDSLCIAKGNELRIWAAPYDADIVDAEKDDDLIVYSHFSNIFTNIRKNTPYEFAKSVIDYYDKRITARWHYGLLLETDTDNEDEDHQEIRI